MNDIHEQIEAVQRMQDYIEAHLFDPITPADLSEASHYSPWYAQRLFQKLVGMAVGTYIRRLRLSKSALRLRDDACRIADIAFEVGFGSVDGYQRAFLREFGCNPGEYALDPTPVCLFIPYGVKFRQMERRPIMANVKHVFIQVVEKPARCAIIKRGVSADDYFSYCGEVGCDVWGLLTSIRSISGEPVCMWLPEAYREPGTSEYVQGVEVPEAYGGVVPEGFDVIRLPAAKYLMFQGEPFDEEEYCQAIEDVRASIETYDPSVIGYAWDGRSPRIQLEPVGSRGYIEMVPIC